MTGHLPRTVGDRPLGPFLSELTVGLKSSYQTSRLQARGEAQADNRSGLQAMRIYAAGSAPSLFRRVIALARPQLRLAMAGWGTPDTGQGQRVVKQRLGAPAYPIGGAGLSAADGEGGGRLSDAARPCKVR